MEIKNVAMVGLGAIGTVFARHIIKTAESFAVVAGGSRGEKIRQNGQTINGEHITPNVVNPNDTNWKADLVIFTVKNYQLEQAIEDVKNIVTKDTILLTIINGVSARDRIKSFYPDNTVLYGLCSTDAERDKTGGIYCSYEGQIKFGNADNTVMSPEVKAVKELFDASGIDSEAPKDMMRALWYKFMVNVSVNQLSAVTHSGYGGFVKIPELNNALRQVMGEVITLANKMGINITQSDAEEHINDMSGSDPDGMTSMLQDVVSKRKTEVDYFAGTMIQLGKKYNVPTPWNDRLYLLIKTIETLYLAN